MTNTIFVNAALQRRRPIKGWQIQIQIKEKTIYTKTGKFYDDKKTGKFY